MPTCGKLRKSMLAYLFGIVALFGIGESSGLYAQFGPPGDFGGRDRDRGDRGDRGDRDGGRRGGFDPSEFVRRMDQNGDGMITANEAERVPSFIRDRWAQQGMDINRGIRVDDMVASSQRQMEEFRRQREEGGGRSDRESSRPDRPDFQPPPDMNQGRSSSSSTPSSSGQSSKPRTRISPLLSDAYKSMDFDLDGQIALYEWRKAKRTISQFTQYDENTDGFLTAKELAKSPAPAATATPSAPGTPTSTASSAPAPSNATSAPLPSTAPVEVSAAVAAKAGGLFGLLDTDRSGTVVGSEWDKSSRLKPLFEKGGYDLSKPLNKDEFTQAYVRVGADK